MSLPQISPGQLRAARAWLDISQDDLAIKAQVGRRAIADFERGARIPFDRTLDLIRSAVDGLGVEFLFDGPEPIGIQSKKQITPSP